MKTVQVVGKHTMHGAEPSTHVRVEIFEALGMGIRRRLDTFDLSFTKLLESNEETLQAVGEQLSSIGILHEGDAVMSEGDARVLTIAALTQVPTPTPEQ